MPSSHKSNQKFTNYPFPTNLVLDQCWIEDVPSELDQIILSDVISLLFINKISSVLILKKKKHSVDSTNYHYLVFGLIPLGYIRVESFKNRYKSHINLLLWFKYLISSHFYTSLIALNQTLSRRHSTKYRNLWFILLQSLHLWLTLSSYFMAITSITPMPLKLIFFNYLKF